MSSFDITVLSAAPAVGLKDDTVLEVMLPVVLPLGNSAVHAGNIRFGMDQQTAREFFENGLKQTEDMKPPSKLEVASSLPEAEKAAERLKDLTS
jgi:hypothetical protein